MDGWNDILLINGKTFTCGEPDRGLNSNLFRGLVIFKSEKTRGAFMDSTTETSDEILSFLLECFPDEDFDTLLEAVKHSHCKEEAMDYVLAHLHNDEAAPIDFGQELLAQLVDVFPEIKVCTLLDVIDRREDGDDLEDLIDIVMVQSIELCEGLPDQSWTRKMKKSKRKLKVEFKYDLKSQDKSPNDVCTTIGPFVYEKFAQLEVPASYDLDTTGLREEVSRLLTLRKQYFAQATEAYQKGGLTGSQSAVYFSDKAKELEKRIDKLKLEAAYRTFLKTYTNCMLLFIT